MIIDDQGGCGEMGDSGEHLGPGLCFPSPAGTGTELILGGWFETVVLKLFGH